MTKRLIILVGGIVLTGVLFYFLTGTAAASNGELGTPCEDNPDVCASGLVCAPEGTNGSFVCSHCIDSTECQDGDGGICTGQGICTYNNPPGGLPVVNPPPGNTGVNNPPPKTTTGGFDFTIGGLVNLVTGVACWSIRAVLALMVIALIIAGLRFFWARGEQTAVTEAKKNFTWVIIGIVVILGTNIIIATVSNALGGDYSYLPLKCSTK